jgi:hypothetical protein
LAGLAAGSSVVNVNIYNGFTYDETTDLGAGAPYSDLLGSFTSPDIMFYTNAGGDWFPLGLRIGQVFGADITGWLDVASSGNYAFTLNSDDGSILLIDGGQVVYDGGAHSLYQGTGTASLTAGLHPFEVQFFEVFGPPSGVDLILPEGVTYGGPPVPEPLTITGLVCGLGGLGAYIRRRLAAK